MWLVGVCLALSFFLFKAANYQWAQLDGPATFHLYPGNAIWCFFPGFAAVGIPWPLTIWLLRRLGRSDEADNITTESNLKGGMNSYKVMKWMIFCLIGPIGFASMLAIPIHLTITNDEARLGRYASLDEEVFRFVDARRATIINRTYRANGQINRHRDLLIDFQDGRRLDANAAGDGGTEPSEGVIQFLLAKTGLQDTAKETAPHTSDREAPIE